MSHNKLLFLLIAFICLIAICSFLVSPFFEIHQVLFQGFSILKESELVKKIKPLYNTNIFMVDNNSIRDKLLKDSYIKDITIKKKFPDKLMITITERIPLAKINNNGKYLVFTHDGYIVETGSLKSKITVPEIIGVGYSLDNNKLLFSPQLTNIVQALQKLDKETRAMILVISLKNKKLSMNLSSQTYVFLDSVDELVDKFRILHSILNKISQEKIKVEYIDLSIAQKPVIKLLK